MEATDKDSGKSKVSDIPDSLSTLNFYRFSSYDIKVIKLPKELKEVSGLTSTPEGRLFAHNDEAAVVYEIDAADGSLIKKFAVGRPALKDDFEDIEYVEGIFYLVNSKGDIFEFKESGNGEYSEYTKHNTALSSSYDVEGLCYDNETNSLLLACKGFSGVPGSDYKSVFSFSLNNKKLSDVPKFTVNTDKAGKRFAPSGIRKNFAAETFYIISATGNSIVELSKDGHLIGIKELSPKIHEQPEGITFMPDKSLLIGNEGKSGNGYIVIIPHVK